MLIPSLTFLFGQQKKRYYQWSSKQPVMDQSRPTSYKFCDINSDILFADKTETYPIVPVIEFIEHSRWMDGISPRWCDSTYPASFNAGEVLKWAPRLMSASQPPDMPRLIFDSIYRLLPSCCIVRLVSVFFRNWSHSFLSLTSRVHSHELPRC